MRNAGNKVGKKDIEEKEYLDRETAHQKVNDNSVQ